MTAFRGVGPDISDLLLFDSWDLSMQRSWPIAGRTAEGLDSTSKGEICEDAVIQHLMLHHVEPTLELETEIQQLSVTFRSRRFLIR